MSANQMRFRDWYGYDTFMGTRLLRKLGNNTYCMRRLGYEHDYFEVTYHGSVIVRCMVDYISYFNRGYATVTTKTRLNDMMPNGWRLYQRKYVWYVWNYTDKVDIEWYDGITFMNEGIDWVIWNGTI